MSEKGSPALEETGSDRRGRARKEGRRVEERDLATEEGESGSPRAKKMLSIFGERVSEKGSPALEETGSDRRGRARKEGRRAEERDLATEEGESGSPRAKKVKARDRSVTGENGGRTVNIY